MSIKHTDEFYELDLNEGIIRFRPPDNLKSNERVFFISAEGWKSLERGLYQHFGTGAVVILDTMAREYGASITRRAMRQRFAKDRKIGLFELLEHYADNCQLAGWGLEFVSTPSTDSLGDGIIRLKIKNCVFCSHTTSDVKEEATSRASETSTSASSEISTDRGQKTYCFFVGILSGLIDELLQSQYKVWEDRCSGAGQGSNICEIAIKQEESDLEKAPKNCGPDIGHK